jgi:hypothetical protein
MAPVMFRFSYDGLIKLAIAVCAANGLRAKSTAGHHYDLIEKLSVYLNDVNIKVIGNRMRDKRNRDLYDGGIVISEKDANEYLTWIINISVVVKRYLQLQSIF